MNKTFDECVALSANIANDSKFRHYSFVVQFGRVLGHGINRYVDNYHGRNVYTVHSEIDAIRRCRALIDWKRSYHMVNIRRGRHGLLLSCPCGACMKVLVAMGFHSITFSTSNGGSAKGVLNVV